MRGVRWALGLFFSVAVLYAGCGLFPAYTARNQTADVAPGREPPKPVIAASGAFGNVTLPRDVFLGIAISGGGSRAANFGIAALRELSGLGLLQRAAALSSVSGGSLAAAYYAQYRPNDDQSWEMAGKVLRTNFFRAWAWHLLLPQNLALMAFTDFDRSDVMADIFDSTVFHGATFGNLARDAPRLFINATGADRQQFLFSEESFDSLGSRLDTYRLADAVMASGAFPLAFNNVTLAVFQKPGERQPATKAIQYRHLFDGGAADNLGIETLSGLLENVVASAHERGAQLPRCMFVLIDADRSSDPDGDDPTWYERDTRGIFGRIADGNVFTSIDAMFAHRRAGQLEDLRPTNGHRFPGLPTWRHRFVVDVDGTTQDEVMCFVWHVHFARLKTLAKTDDPRVRQFREATWRVAQGAQTHYKLTGLGISAEAIQKALFDAAHILVREDDEALVALRAAGLFDPERLTLVPEGQRRACP